MELTDKILIQNGWELVTIPDVCNGTEDWFIWPNDSKIEIPFRLQRGYDENAYWLCVGMGGLLTHINTVEELQLAYDLCKINIKIKID